MARVPLTIDHNRTGKYVLNFEPDASWILRPRWDTLTPQQQSVCAPICPDFVIELWSPSDILNEIQFKLDEYVANGAKLGFLIYPPQRNVYVYRPATSRNAWTILDPCRVIPNSQASPWT